MTDNHASPGEVLAAQTRHWRKHHRLTASELAGRIRELGPPMNRQGVEAIERGVRQVKADELVAIGAVLQVPLGVLLFGLGVEEQVGLGRETGHPDMWQQWLEAADSTPGFRPSVDPFWKIAATPVWAYQELRRWQERSVKLRSRIEAARIAGNADVLAKVVDQFLEVAQEMAGVVEDMKADGIRHPDFYPEFVDYVRQLKAEGGDDGER